MVHIANYVLKYSSSLPYLVHGLEDFFKLTHKICICAANVLGPCFPAPLLSLPQIFELSRCPEMMEISNLPLARFLQSPLSYISLTAGETTYPAQRPINADSSRVWHRH